MERNSTGATNATTQAKGLPTSNTTRGFMVVRSLLLAVQLLLYISRSSQKTHADTFWKKMCFRCRQCNISCASTGDLKKHVRTHSGGKPYSYTQCTFSSKESGNLRKHMRTHSGEKPFCCSQCNFTCTRIDNLKNHMRIHSGEKPFKCDRCNCSSTESGPLTIHKRTHTGEKHTNVASASIPASNPAIFKDTWKQSIMAFQICDGARTSLCDSDTFVILDFINGNVWDDFPLWFVNDIINLFLGWLLKAAMIY